MIISGINNEYKSIILNYAFIFNETEEWIAKVLETFSSLIYQPKTIIIDWCSTLTKAVTKVFPSSKLIWWQWHVRQNLVKNFIHLKAKHNILFKEIISLPFIQTKKEFNEKVKVIKNSISDSWEKYFDWIISKRNNWCLANLLKVFTAGTWSTSRSESIHSLLKRKLWKSKKFSEIHKIIEDINLNTILNAIENTQEIYHNPLLIELKEKFSKYAFEQLLYQFMLSHNHYVKQNNQYDSVKIIFSVLDQGSKFKVKISSSSQSDAKWKWLYFRSHDLYWSHIFAVWTYLQVKQLNQINRCLRWRKHLIEN